MGIKLWRKYLLGLWDDRKSNVDTSGGCKLFPTVDQWTHAQKTNREKDSPELFWGKFATVKLVTVKKESKSGVLSTLLSPKNQLPPNAAL